MATIDIKRAHSIGKDKAREATQQIADRLKAKMDVTYRWEGDTLKFERTGASGTIKVSDTAVEVAVDLNMMLRPMKGKVQEKIEHYFSEYLK